MEGSDNSNVGRDQGSLLETPYYTPYKKQVLQKSGLQPVVVDFSPSSGGDSSVTSMKEGSGSPSSSSLDSEPESFILPDIHYHGLPENTDGKGHPEGTVKEEFPDVEPQSQIVGEIKTDGISWESENRSYDELFREFVKNEEELKVSDFKLKLSEEEIVKLKIQVEKSEGQLNNVQKEFPDVEPRSQIVGEEKADGISWESENRSYDELFREFIKNEEELKVSDFKLKLSEEEIVKLKIQVEKSEGQLNNVQKELKMKEENLEYEKGQVLELQKQTADLETHVPDCCYKIAKLVEQLEVAEEQLKISNNEIARLKEELNNRSSGNRELQGQLELARENVATLECQLDSEKKQIRDLEDTITWYKTNESNHEFEVQKLKAEMCDARAQFSLEKDQMHSDIVRLSEETMHLGSRLEEYESRSNVLENKLRQSEAEKLKLEELLATQQMVLEGEISCLKEEVDQRRHDVEAVNKEFDSHKLKYDMLMTERDEANAKIHKLAAEASFRDDQIANMERELFQLRGQKAELILGSATTLNLVDELKLKVQELKKEVTRQNIVISDRAEEKREAIRQLCFSLEHYRSGYQELLQAFAGHKRHTVTAS